MNQKTNALTSRTQADEYAERLYARVPSFYRAYDLEQGSPLKELLTLVGAQVANVRRDLDALWDNFFIETCDDWVVPYLAALVGANLLAHPIGQSNRLETLNTVRRRRTKGTRRMLRDLASEVTGWRTEVTEFFRFIGWSQNVNHVRGDAKATVDVRDLKGLAKLGRADDPFAHSVDLRSTPTLSDTLPDQPRIEIDSLGIGRTAWGTPGRHQIKNLGFFVRRLQTYRLAGVTPAYVLPGHAAIADPGTVGAVTADLVTTDAPDADVETDSSSGDIATEDGAKIEFFTFDPLFRDTPLFVQSSSEPLTLVAFNDNPSQYFGKDVAVSWNGILVASGEPEQPTLAAISNQRFTFGGAASVAVNAELLADPSTPISIRELMIVLESNGMVLGTLDEFGMGESHQLGSFTAGTTVGDVGGLVVRLKLGMRTDGALAAAANFGGAVLAVRSHSTAPLKTSDGLYVYLPPTVLRAGTELVCYVAADGSTYEDPALTKLLRASEGQVFPPRRVTNSSKPTRGSFRNEVIIVDESRLAGGAVTIEPVALPGGESKDNLLYLRVKGEAVPPLEVIVQNSNGKSLLVYLPEIQSPADGNGFLVADDGSTYRLPTLSPDGSALRSFNGLTLARASAGQTLPVTGVWPLRHRQLVAIDLRRRRQAVGPNELAIDPECGRFAFSEDDPLNQQQDRLTVDYVEAFSADVGARTFDRADDVKPRTRKDKKGEHPILPRYVSKNGVAGPSGETAFASIKEAIAALSNVDEIIEILDSATYDHQENLPIKNSKVHTLVIRAANWQRPCLTFYAKAKPTTASIVVETPLAEFELNGLLLSGGPICFSRPQSTAAAIIGCSLDPLTDMPSLWAPDGEASSSSALYVCRSIVGRLIVGTSIGRLVVADSIVDQRCRGDFAIHGVKDSANNVHLERVTVFGRISAMTLSASECILDDVAIVGNPQTGCLRYSRFEQDKKHRLPRRYACLPDDEQLCGRCPEGREPVGRCLAPVFNSRTFGRPDYAQLAVGCPVEILRASTEGSEIGAFTSALNTIRFANLRAKLLEFLPAGLKTLVVCET